MIKQLSSKVIYQNKWIKVREDHVSFPNKTTGIYSVVEPNNFAMIAPFDGEKFTLIKVFRYPTGNYSWEFPSGGIEASAEGIESAAHRELREETGLTSNHIKNIGWLHTTNGLTTQKVHFFYATQLEKGTQHLDSTESELEVGSFSLHELESMINSNTITDAPTVNLYGLLKLKKII